jgi:hypothetical protein
MEQFKVILTQDDCDTIPRKGYVGVGNPNVYLKPLNKVWEILKGAYDARNIMIVDDSKEKHVCNDEGNYVITKGYNCDDVNDTYLLDRLWPCLLHLNGVTNVSSLLNNVINYFS